MKRDNHLKPLSEALEDHSAEGIAILTAEPVRMAYALVLTMVALVVAGLLWSFIGRADVIVSAQGTLAPESDQTSSISGCAERMLTATGMPPAIKVPQKASTQSTPAG